jgi:antirestriction protein
MISAYIENAGKRAEGIPTGEWLTWLTFPTTKEDVQALLSRIDVDGVKYEEIIITDCNAQIAGLGGLGEYENLDELNYLASLLVETDVFSLDRYEAAAIKGDYNKSAKDLINLTHNPGCFEYFPGIDEDDELGRYLIDVLDMEKISGKIEPYFDYDAYGRDYRLNTGGIYVNALQSAGLHQDRGRHSEIRKRANPKYEGGRQRGRRVLAKM